ncbi:Hypothetical predicted protein [Octopus vulgaris]|uniref:Uncharacterized protein n=1 Tax=Octopus vulgaris TaxID=6645 RepID=A0AA36F4B9_OCTVU|nr:Hypothetical predicted protein [Octopus vulgaris]
MSLPTTLYFTIRKIKRNNKYFIFVLIATGHLFAKVDDEQPLYAIRTIIITGHLAINCSRLENEKEAVGGCFVGILVIPPVVVVVAGDGRVGRGGGMAANLFL